jgi:DeoR family fructose operon transcriptional repressor
MVSAARRVVVVSDSTKSGDDHLHRFAHLEDVHLLITDDQLPDEVASELRDAGVEVVCA